MSTTCWDEQTVSSLNLQQLNLLGGWPTHPYTCANRTDGQHGSEGGDLGVLIATAEGWVCPHCDYTQVLSDPPIATAGLVGLIGPDGFEAIGPTRADQLATANASLSAYEALASRHARGADRMVAALRARRDALSIAPAKPEPLSMWVVYAHPDDYPDHFVARRFEIDGEASRPTNDLLHALTLDELRAQAPPGAYALPRSPGDMPAIVESWI